MTARITSIAFDENHFQLSPHATQFAFTELRDKFLVVAVCRKEDFTNFIDVFSEEAQGEVLGVPEGAYSLQTRLEGEPHQPHVVFDVVDLVSQSLVTQAHIDCRDFVSKFEQAMMARETNHTEIGEFIHLDPTDDFEATWSVAYLKTKLGDKIQGNDAFWQQLNGDLDMVLIPVNLRMDMAVLSPGRELSVEVVYGHDPMFAHKN